MLLTTPICKIKKKGKCKYRLLCLCLNYIIWNAIAYLVATRLYLSFLIRMSLHMLMCKWGNVARTVINFSQTLIYGGRLVYCCRKLTFPMNMQHVLLSESIIFFKLNIPIVLTELESDLFRNFVVLRWAIYAVTISPDLFYAWNSDSLFYFCWFSHYFCCHLLTGIKCREVYLMRQWDIYKNLINWIRRIQFTIEFSKIVW